MSVPTDHGLAFEEILRSCGLTPQQITLELDADGLEDVDHFTLAVSYTHLDVYKRQPEGRNRKHYADSKIQKT